MFHMLTCFNLAAGEEINDFQIVLTNFASHMQNLDMLESTGPIGLRQTDTIMDTDEERDHQYFFTMSFRDRAQCDRAVEHIYSHVEPHESLHTALFGGIRDQVFICWEDIETNQSD